VVGEAPLQLHRSESQRRLRYPCGQPVLPSHSDWFERASIWPHRHQVSNGVLLDGPRRWRGGRFDPPWWRNGRLRLPRRSSAAFGRSCSGPRSSSRSHRPRSRQRAGLLWSRARRLTGYRDPGYRSIDASTGRWSDPGAPRLL